MPTVPPLKEAFEALSQCVLPGAGGAALVLALFLLFGRWSAAIGSAAAIAAAFVWGNFTLANLSFEDPKPTWANTSRLLIWKLSEWQSETEPPGFLWIPHAAFVLVVVGLVSRWAGLALGRVLPERGWWGANLFVWLPRAGAVIVVSEWLVRGTAAAAPEWSGLQWQLAAVMLALWIATDGVSRGGASAEVCAYLAAALVAGGMILLYARTARFMELSMIIGAGMFGIAAVGGAASSDAGATGPNGSRIGRPCVSGALPAAVVFLVGLVLGGRPSLSDNKVPMECFWLVSLAPLLFVPFLIPWLGRQNKWLLRAVRLVVLPIPLVLAIHLAAKAGKLPYEEEDEWSRAAPIVSAKP